MFQIVQPPNSLYALGNQCSVFLAGSIEQGAAENWQSYVARSLNDLDITVLNPRRNEWDSSWVQSITDSNFREQVEWELAAQELSTVIAMFLEPRTLSPVSLLELGLFARTRKMIVCCPEGFWRKGNVEIVCAKYDVPLVQTLDELIAVVRSKLA